MHICTTTTRVCAIIGLGAIVGVGHALIVRVPVGFGHKAIVAPVENTGTAIPVVHVPELTNEDPGENPTEAPAIDPLDILGPPGKLTLREVYALYDEGAYFVDARHQEEFDESHIAGALFLPAQRIRSKAGLDELEMIPPDITIVIYCVGGECDASENAKLAIERSGFGFTDIRITGRGFEDWAGAGLPVEHADGTITGDQP